MNEIYELTFHTEDALIILLSDNALKAYLVVMLLIFLESGLILTPFLPGDILLFSIGLVSFEADFRIGLLVPALIAAAILGNILNYWCGAYFGRRLETSDSRFVRRRLLPSLGKAKDFYTKYGGRSILLGRFFPFIRTFVPFIAGLVRVRFADFSLFSTVGAILWICSFTLAGYYIGHIAWVRDNYEFAVLGMVFVTLLPLAYKLIKGAASKVKAKP